MKTEDNKSDDAFRCACIVFKCSVFKRTMQDKTKRKKMLNIKRNERRHFSYLKTTITTAT